jgi:hypothetical protein
MVKIAFWDNGLGERGTSVSLYDYAHFNETILGNESIIMYNLNHYSNKQTVVDKFTSRFTVIGVNAWEEVDPILISTKCDIIYIIKAGENDGQVSRVCKTVVHCVFTAYQPHGDVYSTIAPWVHGNDGKYPFVPHMINLPNTPATMREQFNIPAEAIVFGRHGGYEQFDIPYVRNAVYSVASANPHIYFIFVNTRPFCDGLNNVIYLPPIIDLEEKSKFINTCDAMMWGRSDGEVFSLSQGEFCIKNKPIICTRSGYLGHVHLLKDKAIWYDETTLVNILTTFKKDNADWNAYIDYTPENVMSVFKRVFIDTQQPSTNPAPPPVPFRLSWR